jgi:hypothetical protein
MVVLAFLVIIGFVAAGFGLLYLLKKFIDGIVHNEEDDEPDSLIAIDRDIEDRLNNRPEMPKD